MTSLKKALPASLNLFFFLLYAISCILPSIADDVNTNNNNNNFYQNQQYNQNTNSHHYQDASSKSNKNSNNNNNDYVINMPQDDQPAFRVKDNPCDYPCKQCSEVKCPEGVNQVMDGCGCCPMCARQQGDLCTQHEKCDEQKSLYCDMNIDGGNRGICRAKNGRSCNISSRIVNDGFSLDLNCSLKCYCQDGRYACTTLCPQELRRPSPTHCKDAQLVSIKDRCCKEWVCPHPHNLINPDDTLSGNHYLNSDRGCKKQVAKWSACDKQCGYGESVRLTNDNEACEPEKESRICMLRPCGLSPDLSTETNKDTKAGNKTAKKCRATVSLKSPTIIKHAGCSSRSMYPIKYCAQCKRCCGPVVDETREVEMVCDGGKVVTKKFMFIEKCECFKKENESCPYE